MAQPEVTPPMHNETFRGLRSGPSRPLRRVAGLIGTAILVAACGSAGSTPTSANPTFAASTGGAGTGITVTESEYKIGLSAASAAAGPVTFHITNSGTTVHEFVVIKTATMAGQLPLASGGTEIDEEATGLTAIDEVEDIAAGAKADLNVTLDAGHYVVICNVPGHYQLGMQTDFTVGP